MNERAHSNNTAIERTNNEAAPPFPPSAQSSVAQVDKKVQHESVST